MGGKIPSKAEMSKLRSAAQKRYKTSVCNLWACAVLTVQGFGFRLVGQELGSRIQGGRVEGKGQIERVRELV